MVEYLANVGLESGDKWEVNAILQDPNAFRVFSQCVFVTTVTIPPVNPKKA